MLGWIKMQNRYLVLAIAVGWLVALQSISYGFSPQAVRQVLQQVIKNPETKKSVQNFIARFKRGAARSPAGASTPVEPSGAIAAEAPTSMKSSVGSSPQTTIERLKNGILIDAESKKSAVGAALGGGLVSLGFGMPSPDTRSSPPRELWPSLDISRRLDLNSKGNRCVLTFEIGACWPCIKNRDSDSCRIVPEERPLEIDCGNSVCDPGMIKEEIKKGVDVTRYITIKKARVAVPSPLPTSARAELKPFSVRVFYFKPEGGAVNTTLYAIAKEMEKTIAKIGGQVTLRHSDFSELGLQGVKSGRVRIIYSKSEHEIFGVLIKEIREKYGFLSVEGERKDRIKAGLQILLFPI